MKRNAPGHDELTIACFKELGYGGKHKFLDIANEIYFTGNYPKTWKQAIMVPISVSDPYHFDADPDPDPRIRIRDDGSGS